MVVHHQITQGAAAQSRHETDGEHPHRVHILPPRCDHAGDGKGNDADHFKAIDDVEHGFSVTQWDEPGSAGSSVAG